MKTLPLGQNGPLVPEFCLGTMTWGRQTDEVDAHRQIDLALDHGINFLDTAEMYPTNPVMAETRGGTEAIIGNWIAKTGGRDRLILAPKVSGVGSHVMEGGTPPIDGPRLRSAVEESLQRLQTEHIDLFQLHWPNRGSYQFRRNWTYKPPHDAAHFRAHVHEILTEAAALIAEGKIGHIALSNESAWGLAQWIRASEEAGLPRIASIQNEYSLLARLPDTDLAEACAMEDVPVLAFSPLAAGLLTGKYAGDVTPDDSRRAATPDLGGRITPRVFEAVSAYLGLARDHGVDPVVMALAWHRTRPFTSLPIIGATTTAQLESQLPALHTELTQELIDGIDAVHRAHPMPY
ncbi:aldo/keto reductase [Pararhodobacter sp. CCB-MM2]|uniref:aldo/keto reductase n=1 Tax=Pararhodobacter sp. CCB-MM2 TaxID=1786003 RepID=UPI0008344A6B|nr:aldo/keto reductase [Pararhodobacter sp. CCB-MM2]